MSKMRLLFVLVICLSLFHSSMAYERLSEALVVNSLCKEGLAVPQRDLNITFQDCKESSICSTIKDKDIEYVLYNDAGYHCLKKMNDQCYLATGKVIMPGTQQRFDIESYRHANAEITNRAPDCDILKSTCRACGDSR